MRPDEIAIAVNWAAAEGWNPGFADDVCFAAVDSEGFFIGERDGVPVAALINSGSSPWPDPRSRKMLLGLSLQAGGTPCSS